MSDNWVVQNLENALETWNEKLSEIWTLMTAIIVNIIKNRKKKTEGFPLIPYLAVGFMAAYFM